MKDEEIPPELKGEAQNGMHMTRKLFEFLETSDLSTTGKISAAATLLTIYTSELNMDIEEVKLRFEASWKNREEIKKLGTLLRNLRSITEGTDGMD